MQEIERSINIAAGNVRLRVTGLTKTLRAMRKAGADMQEMPKLMHDIGMTVVNAAKPLTPRAARHTFPKKRLSETLRAGRGKTKAVVRAGFAFKKSKKTRYYAPIIHYGWPARGIPARPFLVNALAANQQKVIKQLAAGLGDILSKNHLDNNL